MLTPNEIKKTRNASELDRLISVVDKEKGDIKESWFLWNYTLQGKKAWDLCSKLESDIVSSFIKLRSDLTDFVLDHENLFYYISTRYNSAESIDTPEKILLALMDVSGEADSMSFASEVLYPSKRLLGFIRIFTDDYENMDISYALGNLKLSQFISVFGDNAPECLTTIQQCLEDENFSLLELQCEDFTSFVGNKDEFQGAIETLNNDIDEIYVSFVKLIAVSYTLLE